MAIFSEGRYASVALTPLTGGLYHSHDPERRMPGP
jgi:hypothetical protein